MRSQLVFGALLLLYGLSFFLRGEDPRAQLGPQLMEGVFFQGGYGLQWVYDAGAEFERAHPEIQAHVWGNPRAWDQSRSRFLAGNPPDAFWCIHNINFWVNLQDGLVSDLDSLMNAPAYGQEDVKFKDTFLPGTLEQGQYQGKQYFLPITYAVEGIWYNKRMFDERGWVPASTWDEFLALCERIKTTSSIAPLTHQGKYPSYFGMIFRGLLYKLGGEELYLAIDNLEPGAWQRPEVVRAAGLSRELVEQGYVLEGSSSFSHTEGQMIWLQEKAAMIPCGTWLESEMKNALPPGFEMRLMPVPGFPDGKGGQKAVGADAGPAFWVPRQAAHPDWGMEYFRILLSRKMAANFLATIGSVMPIRGSTEGVPIPPAMQSALDAVQAAGNETFNLRFLSWYPELRIEYENALGAVLNGDLSPQGFADRIEAQAQRLRQDPDRVRMTRLPSKPLASR
ncbi:MAG: extracellular solute-binding protein [Candidatus Handelsmanbacteria bacterium]|nr:extracellular solute-binding protein [Candidatus Handelsmanbacteria bacterium]